MTILISHLKKAPDRMRKHEMRDYEYFECSRCSVICEMPVEQFKQYSEEEILHATYLCERCSAKWSREVVGNRTTNDELQALTKEQVLEWREQGIKNSDMIRMLKCSTNAFYKKIAELGVPLLRTRKGVVQQMTEPTPNEETKDNTQLVEGLAPDAPVVENKHGGKQSYMPYRFDLIDPLALFEMAKVLREGFEKYGADENWRRIPANEHINHMITHAFAYLAGDKSDEHLSHMLCRALFAQGVALQNDSYVQARLDWLKDGSA